MQAGGNDDHVDPRPAQLGEGYEPDIADPAVGIIDRLRPHQAEDLRFHHPVVGHGPGPENQSHLPGVGAIVIPPVALDELFPQITAHLPGGAGGNPPGIHGAKVPACGKDSRVADGIVGRGRRSVIGIQGSIQACHLCRAGGNAFSILQGEIELIGQVI